MTSDGFVKPDQRYRLGKLQVLVADGNHRSARLVHNVLQSFGIKSIETASTAEDVLESMRKRRTDLLITEQVLEPTDGKELVRTLRSSKGDRRLRHDIPIIMLTAHSGRNDVKTARDAGITEFVAKPFSAATLASRLIEIIDNPRAFVETNTYAGPSRRRKQAQPPGEVDRRAPLRPRAPNSPTVNISRPNRDIRQMVEMFPGNQILTTEVIEEAQVELLKSEAEFVKWVKDDLATLERAYEGLAAAPGDVLRRKHLLMAAYTIKSQAGIFGYDLATTVADQLILYLLDQENLSTNSLIVVRKQIDIIQAVFTYAIKDIDSVVAKELVTSLNALIAKFT